MEKSSSRPTPARLAAAGGCLVLALIALLLHARVFSPAPAADDAQLLVIRLLDVGQADCVLVTQGGEAMLIDCGDAADEPQILRQLADHGVTSLSCLVLTHPHADHIGAAAGVLSAVDTDTVLLSAPALHAGGYADLLPALEAGGASVRAAVPGEVFSLGGAQVTVLGPEPHADAADLNEVSVCLRVCWGTRCALFTGDAGFAQEAALLQSGYALSADILKAPHHGSDGSAGEAFLAAVSPAFVLVSCCQDTPDDLPGSEALARFEACGASVLRSDRHGCITVTVSPQGELRVTTER